MGFESIDRSMWAGSISVKYIYIKKHNFELFYERNQNECNKAVHTCWVRARECGKQFSIQLFNNIVCVRFNEIPCSNKISLNQGFIGLLKWAIT